MDSRITAEAVLGELAAIGFARVSDFLWVKDGTLEIRDIGEMSPDGAAAVASVEKTTTGVKVKFYDKLKALERLGKAMGRFEGLAAEQEDNNLLEAILLATKKEVDTCDLPEVQQAAAVGDELVEPAEAGGI